MYAKILEHYLGCMFVLQWNTLLRPYRFSVTSLSGCSISEMTYFDILVHVTLLTFLTNAVAFPHIYGTPYSNNTCTGISRTEQLFDGLQIQLSFKLKTISNLQLHNSLDKMHVIYTN